MARKYSWSRNPMLIAPRLTGIFVCVIVFLFAVVQATRAEEPYDRFLQKLRDEQLFDLALEYLKGQATRPDASPEFKANIQFEKGILQYQAAARLGFSNPRRAEKLDLAEEALRTFLKNKKHPRRGEARLKLGELLLSRAEEAKLAAETGEVSEAATKFYDDAHKVFEETIKELAGVLENLKGARVDPNDKRKVAYRLKVQQDLRQAQLLSAKSVEERGLSRASKSPERVADLKKAMQMFGDLYSKEQRMVGVRNYALFYRSSIQAKLGMAADAIDGFQRVADLASVDVLRPLQAEAVTELVKLLAADKKYSVAIDRADKWISGIRPDERGAPETMALKLATAKVRIEWSKALRVDEPNSRLAARLIRDTRSDLRSMLRTQGGHLEETKELLAQLGIEFEDGSSEELPVVKNFSEALDEAQLRVEQAEDDELSLEQGLVLLREAIRLYTPSDDREKLFEAKYRVAFLLLLKKDYWASMAISESLAREGSGSEEGMQAARITLNAFSNLLSAADDTLKLQLTRHLEPFAEFMLEAWPQASESAAAGSALVQLAAINGQWDRIERFVGLIPDDGGGAVAKLRRDVGIRMYNRYLGEKGQGVATADVEKLKEEALISLEAGTSTLPDPLDASWIESVSVLVRLYLQMDRIDEAADRLFKGKGAPIKAVEGDSDVVSERVAMNVYRTALQVVVGQLANGTVNSQDASVRSAQYLGKLQSIASKTEDGEAILRQDLVRLVTELDEQLKGIKDLQKRIRLSEALVVIALESAKSDSFRIQYFAAETLVTAAEELAKDRSGAVASKKAFSGAAEILGRILDREESQAGWIEPAGVITSIQVLYAKSLKGSGDFKGAIDILTVVLKESTGLLDAQIAAAETYQAWGQKTGLAYRAAFEGAKRDRKTGMNLIWGWGQIARAVEPHAQHREKFFRARFDLAMSRYKYGLTQTDSKKKELLVKKAEKDIQSTATLYPELGGATMKKKFDVLLRAIKKQLGK